ncbi:twin arginine-targeting protein translocase, TatA/E family [Corynebacterium mustelae]|uniref:Sec-independent protein translocase protein TatA n=1 Tax=Corynebacterium mustelae TaxID=571915 RepID=A0A0G3GXN5_9CORY|nr:Sec-independent protein translocase subunit TatA [Corynebacterium mustelae]AKK05924.1 twin arginine-targeting protein translocase, TatA/E family [Corynebacterium mustelae]
MSVGPLEIGILIVVLILLFGAKKLPDAARSLGRSMRIFKSEVKEMSNDDKRFEEQRALEAQQTQTIQPQPIAQPEQYKPQQQP